MTDWEQMLIPAVFQKHITTFCQLNRLFDNLTWSVLVWGRKEVDKNELSNSVEWMPPSFLQTFVYNLYLNKASKEEQALVFTYISVRQIRFEIFYYSGRIKQNLTSRLKALHSLQTCYLQISWSNGQVSLDDGTVKTAFTKNAWCVSKGEKHQNNS